VISQEAAALLATLYPVGLLIIGIEVRQTPRLIATAVSGRILLFALGASLLLAVVLGMSAVARCVEAVASSVDLSGGDAALVAVAGWLIYAAVGVLFVLNLLDHLGFMDWSYARLSPKRRAAMAEYLDKHPPAGSPRQQPTDD
jgi:hypothetical protein